MPGPCRSVCTHIAACPMLALVCFVTEVEDGTMGLLEDASRRQHNREHFLLITFKKPSPCCPSG